MATSLSICCWWVFGVNLATRNAQIESRPACCANLVASSENKGFAVTLVCSFYLQYVSDFYYWQQFCKSLLSSGWCVPALISMDTCRTVHASMANGVCSSCGLTEQQASMKMAALWQRSRNPHFSAPAPRGVNYGGGGSASTRGAGKVRISPPSVTALLWGSWTRCLSNKFLSAFAFLPSCSFWDLVFLQPSLTSDLRLLDLTHLLRWSSLRSIMAFFLLTSSS